MVEQFIKEYIGSLVIQLAQAQSEIMRLKQFEPRMPDAPVEPALKVL